MYLFGLINLKNNSVEALTILKHILELLFNYIIFTHEICGRCVS